MKTYKCEYVYGQCDASNHIKGKVEASSYREAYEAFLSEHGVFPAEVIVKTGLMDATQQRFSDHVEAAMADTEKKKQQTREAYRSRTVEEAKAVDEAQSSLSSTDILLKQLIAKQDETNQWLRKIRWSIWCILLILVIWNLFGWRIIQIR